MSWHPDPVLLERYGTGALDRVTTASVEAHVTSCGPCRAGIPVDGAWLDASWSALADRVMAPPPTIVEKALRGLGLPEHVARLVITPSVAGRAWFVAVVAALLGAVLFARAAADAVPVTWLLIAAPLAPVAGVAAVYGRRGAPVHEVELASPVDAFRLLLLRSAAVSATALTLALAADLLTPATGWTGAWLLPALALTTSTLALGAWMTLASAGALVATVWVGVVLVATSSGQTSAVFGIAAQGVHLAVLLLATSVLARCWRVFDEGGKR